MAIDSGGITLSEALTRIAELEAENRDLKAKLVLCYGLASRIAETTNPIPPEN